MPQLRMQYLGQRDYATVWQSMREYTDQRDQRSDDEFWILEHPPVFTLGQAGRYEHVLDPGDIPVVRSDRGGQVTYHGPGQVVVYTLVDLRRLHIGIRTFVETLELAVIDLLAAYGIRAMGRREAPGVYVNKRKIASIGLRVRNGCSYHGLALNVGLDMSPFARINPCGYPSLEITSLATLGISMDVLDAGRLLSERLARRLGYTTLLIKSDSKGNPRA